MRQNQPAILYMCKEMVPSRREQLDINRLGFSPKLRNSQHVSSVEHCAGVIYGSDEVRARVLSKVPEFRRVPDGREVWASFIKRQEEAFNDLQDDELDEDEDMAVASEPEDYSKLNKPQLVELAGKRGIADASALTKAQIVKALEAQDEDGGQGAGTGGDDLDFEALGQ